MSGVLVLATTAAQIITVADGSDPGSGRLGSVVAGLLGLACLAAGGLALYRAVRRAGAAKVRAWTATSLVLGAACVTLSAVLLLQSAGDVGSGNGRGGAFVALLMGLTGTSLGGLALPRSRPGGQGSGEQPTSYDADGSREAGTAGHD